MSNPLSKLIDFFRTQLSGAPVAHVEAAVSGIERHVEAEIEAAIAPFRAAVEDLTERFAAIEAGLGITKPSAAPAADSRTGADAPLPEGSTAQSAA